MVAVNEITTETNLAEKYGRRSTSISSAFSVVHKTANSVVFLRRRGEKSVTGAQPLVANLYPVPMAIGMDSVTGLYYARNRNYSPSLGSVSRQEPKSRLSAGAAHREISQDPAGYINGANTYQFVESNPVGNVDPWGLAAGATATGQVIPATTPGSSPGSGSVTVTGTTGPVPTGVPGTTVTIGATGTASTGGNYTGSATGTVTVNTGGGSSVSVSTTGTATGKLTKNPTQPSYQWVVKCQPTVKTPLPGNPPFSPYVIYNPNPGPGNPPWQLGVQSGNFRFNISPNPGGTTFMITGTFNY